MTTTRNPITPSVLAEIDRLARWIARCDSGSRIVAVRITDDEAERIAR